jgi:hypothetical protein
MTEAGGVGCAAAWNINRLGITSVEQPVQTCLLVDGVLLTPHIAAAPEQVEAYKKCKKRVTVSKSDTLPGSCKKSSFFFLYI